MARVQGQRRGVGRRHAGQPSLARGADRRNNNNNNNNNNTTHIPRNDHSTRGALAPKHRAKGKPNTHVRGNRKPGAGHSAPRTSKLEDGLDDILLASALAKHIDPPFTEVEDDFSRLKSQSIQLATLVLHLENKLEAEQRKHQKFQPPEAIVINKLLVPSFSKANQLISTTVKAPATKETHKSSSGHLSILHSSSPKGFQFQPTPNTPGTIDGLASPMIVEMESPSRTQVTPTLDFLLHEIKEAVQSRDGERIVLDLRIEPPLHQSYLELQKELRKHYPWGKDRHLRTLCDRVLPRSPDGTANMWEPFAVHLYQYLQFIRDFAPERLFEVNNKIKLLLNSSVTSLNDNTFGVVILPTVAYISKVLARLSLGLDKRPDLVAQLLNENPVRDDDGIAKKVTLVEDAANIVREAFIKCLSDKSGTGGFGRNAAPQGKRIGIYEMGNICLKLLFQCRKLSSATTIFVSIDAQSPLLSYYPASQRVTYLYYLGRYLFANNHFYRAQLALRSAYDQCLAGALSQRQLILVYLIASNICLGRFPSSKLLLRREAAELAQHFLPLRRLIASGDLAGFHAHLSLGSSHGQWFLRKRLLLQLRNRCEILVWRSLVRRVFIAVGFPGGEDNKTPFLRLHFLQAAARWLNRASSEPTSQPQAVTSTPWSTLYPRTPQAHTAAGIENHPLEAFNSEFAGMDEMIAETGFDVESGAYTGSREQNGGPFGNSHDGSNSKKQEPGPTIEEIESIVASLIQQDLIYGFLTHNNPRLAIPGAKIRGALAVGFPSVWEVIHARDRDDVVPGWVKENVTANNGYGGNPFGGLGGGGGRVINLSGARPVGVGAATNQEG